MSNYFTGYGGGSPGKRGRTGWSLAAMVLGVGVTGFLLWLGLSWAVGLIASALRLTLMTLAIGAVALLLLWIVARGMFRR